MDFLTFFFGAICGALVLFSLGVVEGGRIHRRRRREIMQLVGRPAADIYIEQSLAHERAPEPARARQLRQLDPGPGRRLHEAEVVALLERDPYGVELAGELAKIEAVKQ